MTFSTLFKRQKICKCTRIYIQNKQQVACLSEGSPDSDDLLPTGSDLPTPGVTYYPLTPDDLPTPSPQRVT